MATTFGTNTSVTSTIALLEAQLPDLEAEQASLESKLASVTADLESVRTALSSLKALTPAVLETDSGADTEPVPAAEEDKPLPVGEAPTAKKTTRRGAARTTAAKPAGTGPRRGRKAAEEAQTAEKAAAAPAPRKTATKKATAAKAAPKAVPAKETRGKRSNGIADAVHDALTKAGTPLRAKEVLHAIGLDETSNNMTNVTATLGRLVTRGRARRSGRGLFEPAQQS
ncbi:hypothetical protein [Streptomyces sp. NRRL S-350]|uniref:hypothetical protein n=1 Tax=Streptomyces sp. NRRL S-350 TaxID=1463902 RepID=UPI0004C10991|nr:hypothetical protein [Streptomyces sp. NRRL S-350]